ncbi:hypothetical protein EB796_025091 [Bugula neritina]|nr:hypothetical protein EB796_025091 [Bugula neritina]
MVRDYLMQNARPLTPRMENNQSKANCPSPMDLPIPRHGASTPRETKTTFNNSRKFNPNFMVETVESLKSELQILRNKVKQTHLSKLNQYIVQVESVALAIITFAHVMAVTLML